MQTVANFTPNSIVGEIEKVLDTYPYNPYQQAFSIPDIRQQLIEYVLVRIPCADSSCSVESSQENTNQVPVSKIPRTPLQHQLHLQNLIHQGICVIMQMKSELISQILCETVQPVCEPSHWFG
ncbi:hypothetical protein [Calothrix sp. NIES-3974]|uniref:hypothetical protein n=1 Tax=Calothrix sp. NIES-3974 TaxID=2005462 RepID=UPI000B5DD83D|nr:hypothetical protein [Calothrix sp. NIES-3974]BAZ04668.1 hypothetical protein NIES3974_13110 [Calothrix sp. NIES-3974]